MAKPKIAVFSGPNSTIANSPTLVTSGKARLKDGPERDGRYDHLVPQALYEPVTVQIRKYTAHPLEEDAKALYNSILLYKAISLSKDQHRDISLSDACQTSSLSR